MVKLAMFSFVGNGKVAKEWLVSPKAGQYCGMK